MSPPLNDAQRLAASLRGRDLLVTAGAGTGKTTVLVERVLRHLQGEGALSLDELLVVTFTEKAAREMRERVHRALAERAELRRHLPQLARAAISTIHGFCARFLRENFLEAEIEPGFRVLDEHGAGQMLEDALRRVFHRWYRHEDARLQEDFRRLVEMASFDRQGESLRRVARRLYDYARSTADPDAYMRALRSRAPAGGLQEMPWWDELQRRLWGGERRGLPIEGIWPRAVRLYRAAFESFEASGGVYKTRPMQDLLERLQGFAAEGLRDPGAVAALCAELEAGGHLAGPRGLRVKLPNAPRGAKAGVPGFEELHEAARGAFNDPLLRLLPWDEPALREEDRRQCRSLAVLAGLVQDLDAEYTRAKDRQGLLDFSDLEVRTLRLLRAQGERWRGRYREILIDEFQDVNGLQNEILTRLAAPGGIFRVGDVKQSIYQFRLADPTIFLALHAERPAVRGGESPPDDGSPLAILLAENHRSRPAILRFVNRIFSSLFDASSIGTSYADQALAAHREESPFPVELHLVEKPPAPEPAVRAQARFAARRLRRLILEERPRIPGSGATERAASWRDVALLLRAKTHAGVFLDALRAEGIPAFLGAGGSLLDEESVRDLLSLLSVIDNPRDDVALAAALRSPLFGLTDSDLLRLRLARPQARTFLDAVVSSAYREEPEAEGEAYRPRALRDELSGAPAEEAGDLVGGPLGARVRSALERIAAWRAVEGRTELSQFLGRVIEESGLENALVAGREPRASRAALGKLRELARDYEDERGPSLHGFLARLRALEAGAGIDAVPEVGENEDAVAILTMHKAKGLEFPIVVLPRLEWDGGRGDRVGGRIRIGPHWIGVRTLDEEKWTQRDSVARRALERMQEEAERAEEARVLYVALTRARERLILIGTPSASAERHLSGIGGPPPPAALTAERMRAGRSALDWIAAALAAAGDPPESIPLVIERQREESAAGEAAAGGTAGGTAGATAGAAPEWQQQRVRRLRAPAPASPQAAPELDRLLARVSRASPFPPFASLEGLRGKYWVTEIKSLADEARRASLEADDGADVAGAGAGTDSAAATGAGAGAGAAAEAAARRGIHYHAALARLDLTRLSDEDLEAQLADFAKSAWWEGAPRDAALEAGARRILEEDVGRRLRRAARDGSVEREVPFTLRMPVLDLLPILAPVREAVFGDAPWSKPPWKSALDEAWVIVQGRIDCIFREDGDRWSLLDWKTDAVAADRVAERAAAYEWQMRIYRRAAERLWGEIGGIWLAFLRPGLVVPVDASS